MTVAITRADLDDPRVTALLDEHLGEMEPTAPPSWPMLECAGP